VAFICFWGSEQLTTQLITGDTIGSVINARNASKHEKCMEVGHGIQRGNSGWDDWVRDSSTFMT
jgi:hypothetical protein